ncbi:unnamed protein product, partial [Amoebophrya sp. A25]
KSTAESFIADAEARTAAAETAASEAAANFSAAQKQVQELDATVLRLQEELTQQAQLHEQKLAEMTKSLLESKKQDQSDAEETSYKMRALEAEIKTLQQDLEDAEQSKADGQVWLQEQLENAKRECAEAEERAQTGSEALLALETAKQQHSEEMEKLRTEVTKMEQDLTALRNERPQGGEGREEQVVNAMNAIDSTVVVGADASSSFLPVSPAGQKQESKIASEEGMWSDEDGWGDDAFDDLDVGAGLPAVVDEKKESSGAFLAPTTSTTVVSADHSQAKMSELELQVAGLAQEKGILQNTVQEVQSKLAEVRQQLAESEERTQQAEARVQDALSLIQQRDEDLALSDVEKTRLLEENTKAMAELEVAKKQLEEATAAAQVVAVKPQEPPPAAPVMPTTTSASASSKSSISESGRGEAAPVVVSSNDGIDDDSWLNVLEDDDFVPETTSSGGARTTPGGVAEDLVSAKRDLETATTPGVAAVVQDMGYEDEAGATSTSGSADVQGHVTAVQEELVSAKRDLETEKASVAALRLELESTSQTLKNLERTHEEECAELKNLLAAGQTEVEGYQDRLEALEKEVSDLEQRNACLLQQASRVERDESASLQAA